MAQLPVLIQEHGRYLPGAAWEAALEAGSVDLHRCTFIPAGVSSTICTYKVPSARVAATLLAKSEGPAIRGLVGDTRKSVRSALLSEWYLDGAALDVVLDDVDEDLASTLVGLPMDIARRRRLWARLPWADALLDAVTYSTILRDEDLEDLLTRPWIAGEERRRPDPLVAALLDDHPGLVATVIEEGSPAAVLGASHTRPGVARFEQLLARPTPGYDERSFHIRMLCALADHPAAPQEAREEALSKAAALGDLEHLHYGVIPAAVPHVATVDEWTDAAAAATIPRHTDTFNLPWRLRHLIEVIEADGVSRQLRQVAAYRLTNATAGYSSWYWPMARLSTTLKGLLEPHEFARRLDDVLNHIEREHPPRALEALEGLAPKKPRGTPKPPDPAGIGSMPVKDIHPLSLSKAAVFLAQAVEHTTIPWRLVWELFDGFEGSFDELVAVLNASA